MQFLIYYTHKASSFRRAEPVQYWDDTRQYSTNLIETRQVTPRLNRENLLNFSSIPCTAWAESIKKLRIVEFISFAHPSGKLSHISAVAETTFYRCHRRGRSTLSTTAWNHTKIGRRDTVLCPHTNRNRNKKDTHVYKKPAQTNDWIDNLQDLLKSDSLHYRRIGLDVIDKSRHDEY